MRLHGIEFDQGAIGEACRRAGIVRLYLFGSILSERFDAQSDIDVIVETDPSRPAGLLTLGGLQMDLSELLGRKVHITTLGGIPAGERRAILNGARRLDAA